MVFLWKCIMGPDLYRIYRLNDEPSKRYQKNKVEIFGGVIRWSVRYWLTTCACQIILVVALVIIYKYLEWSVLSIIIILISYLVFVVFIIACEKLLIGIGRSTNPDYVTFLHIYLAACKNYTAKTKKSLLQYDFDFKAWPVDYTCTSTTAVKPLNIHKKKYFNFIFCYDINDLIQVTVYRWLSIKLSNPFEIELHYADDMKLTFDNEQIESGRAVLIEKDGGLRAKLKVKDGNEIDVMFIDKRSDCNCLMHQAGNTLVICCEGSLMFYENGCMRTPIDAGYSVLGWNHPGFGGSSGILYSSSDKCAIDGVMQYAINYLKFNPEDIVLYSWSTGAYAAVMAVELYPSTKSIFLDTVHDTVDYISVKSKQKCSLKKKTKIYISELQISSIRHMTNILGHYQGDVLFIRRTICDRNKIMIAKYLQCKYPKIVDACTIPLVGRFLSSQDPIGFLLRRDICLEHCKELLMFYSTVSEELYPGVFPWQLELKSIEKKQKLSLFLASRCIEDVPQARPCSPVPMSVFKLQGLPRIRT